MKIMLLNILIGLVILTAIQTILFLQKFNGPYFVKYAAVYAGSYYVLLCIVCCPFIDQAGVRALQTVGLWKIDSANEKVQNRIKTESFYINLFIIVNTIVTIYSAILHIIPDEDDSDIFYHFAIFEDYLPSTWANLFSWGYRMTYVPTSVIMVQPCYMVIYVTSHFRFQMYMFLHYLDNINSGHEKLDNEKLFYDKDYQNEIRKRLKFCIKRHRQFYEAMNRTLDVLSKFIVLFAINGAVLGISILSFYFSFKGSFKDKYLRVGSLIIAATLTSGHAILAGQRITDVTSEMFEALKRCKWYHWNKGNSKIYFIFLLNAQQPLELKFSECFSINYQLGV
ncbi:uncharacterized protein BDFB_011854, partial [Asbolus verrucosus]